MPDRSVYALLVGVDDYPPPLTPLRGCVNDVDAMVSLLSGRLGDALEAVVLRNGEATRDALIDAFREHLARAGADDVVLFMYAGHGAQEDAPPEWWAVEPDRRNETLVLWDSRLPGQHDLADKELAILLAEVASTGAHVLVVLDCCHSGSGTRLLPEDQSGVRRALDDERPRPAGAYLGGPEAARSPAGPMSGRSGWAVLPRGRHVLLAGCRSSETAKETRWHGLDRGAMTLALQRAIEQAGDLLSYADLHSWVVADVRNRVADQTPQLEASDPADLGLALLGGVLPPRPRHGTLSHRDGEGWQIDQGQVHGVAVPDGIEHTVFAVFEHGDDLTDPATRVGDATVRSVAPDHCSVDLVSRGPALDTARTYPTVPRQVPLPPVPVSFEGNAVEVEALKAALDGGDGNPASLLVAPVHTGDGAIHVQVTSECVRISRPSSRHPLVADLVGPGVPARLRAELDHIARWLRLADLRNPTAGESVRAARVSLTSADEPQGADVFDRPEGLDLHYVADRPPSFRLSVANRGPVPLFCAILDLTELYGVGSLLTGTAAVEVPAGHDVHAFDGAPIPAWIPDALHAAGVTELTDVLKVVVSTGPFDVRALLQSDLDLTPLRTDQTRATPQTLQNTFDRLINRVAERHVGPVGGDEEAVVDWCAMDVLVHVERPATAGRVNADKPVDLPGGTVVAPHPELRGQVRLASLPEVARSMGSPLPPALRDDPDVEPVVLQRTRATAPDFDVLELDDVEAPGSVTSERPLRLRLEERLAVGEQLLAIAFDGEMYLPLGVGHRSTTGTEVVIERLPEPIPSGRSLTGSISICFRKLVLRRLGADYPYPLLRQVLNADGEVQYVDDPAKVAAAVASAASVLIYVHGIIGDTEGMARSAYRSDLVPCPPLVGDRFDVVLAFDYENLDTSIAQTAADLQLRLEAVGLVAGNGRKLVLVAHSMGGLVSRHLIERLGGDQVVSRLVTLGTPNGGSPWPGVQQWATALLAFGLNRVGDAVWPVKIMAGLVAAIERVDTALDDMTPRSPFLQQLHTAPDPGVGYDVLVGLRSLTPGRNEAPARTGLIRRLLARLSPAGVLDAAVGLVFRDEDNDLAVGVGSARDLPPGRSPEPQVVELGCDHMSYFSTAVGLTALAAALDD